MKPSEALSLERDAVHRIARAYGLRNVRVFGSVARGEDTEGSDIDLLVEAPPGTTLLDLVGMQYEIEDLLGVPVDILTDEELPPKVRARICQDARAV